VVHGDLSEFNILVDAEGPVIIDLPQAVDAAGNNDASVMLERDVDNLAFYFGQFAPELNDTQYGKEIWALYQAGLLHPGVKLTGKVAVDDRPVDVQAVLLEVEDVRLEEEARQRYLQSAE
jgi:RIO kinase 1